MFLACRIRQVSPQVSPQSGVEPSCVAHRADYHTNENVVIEHQSDTDQAIRTDVQSWDTLTDEQIDELFNGSMIGLPLFVQRRDHRRPDALKWSLCHQFPCTFSNVIERNQIRSPMDCHEIVVRDCATLILLCVVPLNPVRQGIAGPERHLSPRKPF